MREFDGRAVEGDLIRRVIEAARLAPMGLPPSDVSILVLDSPEKVRRFSEDLCRHMEKMRWLVSGAFLALMRPFWGRENDELFRGFVRPAIRAFTEAAREGRDLVFYGAPAALYFYGSPYSDPADPVVAATYSMLAAESLGLGTCMVGSVHPFLQYGARAARLRRKYTVRFRSRQGLDVAPGPRRRHIQVRDQEVPGPRRLCVSRGSCSARLAPAGAVAL